MRIFAKPIAVAVAKPFRIENGSGGLRIIGQVAVDPVWSGTGQCREGTYDTLAQRYSLQDFTRPDCQRDPAPKLGIGEGNTVKIDAHFHGIDRLVSSLAHRQALSGVPMS